MSIEQSSNELSDNKVLFLVVFNTINPLLFLAKLKRKKKELEIYSAAVLLFQHCGPILVEKLWPDFAPFHSVNFPTGIKKHPCRLS